MTIEELTRDMEAVLKRLKEAANLAEAAYSIFDRKKQEELKAFEARLRANDVPKFVHDAARRQMCIGMQSLSSKVIAIEMSREI